MSMIQFLAEWALRSSILIGIGGLLLLLLRVKDPSIRLAAWTAMLGASLAMPLFMASVPKAPLVAMGRVVEAPMVVYRDVAPVSLKDDFVPVRRFDWPRAALIAYGAVALTLLLRLCVGLAMSLRLLRASRATDETTEGIAIRESDHVTAPVTLGILHPAILLPTDWRQWSAAKLDAVLAHERSHIRRFDPVLQLLSAVHRALLWHNPMSWFLHNRIVRIAEEASDDAALAVAHDRAFYAEMLLGFMRPGGAQQGIPMARRGCVEARIHRILDGTAVSRGLTRGSLAAILLAGSPLTYLAAAAHPAEQTQSVAQAQPAVTPIPAPAPVKQPQPKPKVPAAYLRGLGSVVASATVVVKPRIDGELKSVSFREGELVQQGQLLASLDTQSLEIQFVQADAHLTQDEALLAAANHTAYRTQTAPPLEIKVSDDQAEISNVKLRMAYAEIRSPITGIAGLRMVDAGNMIHAGQPIVVITQLEPAAVLFTLPEDALPRIHAILRNGASPVAEAWNRDESVKIATGHLAAVDNQIDEQTGTIKLKALFDNKGGELVPGQFVNVRLLVAAR